MKISVLGLGAYGIALAKTFYNNDNKVSLWSKFEDEVQTVLLKRENKRLLPGVKIPKDILITSDLSECVSKSKVVVIAVPAFAIRDVAKLLKEFLTEEQVICIATKGIERGSNKLMSEVVFEETGCKNICVLSGPSFAKELANKNQTGLVVASNFDVNSILLKVCLENDYVFVNITKDIIGVQICSAVKNVFAILMGIVDGMKLSSSTKAAIFTCVLSDFRFVIEMLSGKAQTIFSYAGIGDFFLTCTSDTSRNFKVGSLIGKGNSFEKSLEILGKDTTIEGVYTLKSIHSILTQKDINVKSIKLLYGIIYLNEKTTNILREIKK